MKTTVCPLCEGNIIAVEALEAFKKEMVEKTIPQIIETVRKRQELAIMNRNKVLK